MRFLTRPSAFCHLMAQARDFKVPGWWDGSAYRSHPCGFFAEGLIFTNEWHRDDYCSIRAMRNPSEPLGRWCHDSFAHGNPHPSPASGTEVVWSNGKWCLHGPWVQKAERILASLALAVSARAGGERLRKAAIAHAAAEQRKASLSALAAAHAGGTP